MVTEHVSSNDILSFAENSVNLKRNDATKYRGQVKHLREKLQSKISEDPDYKLKKMLLSGSLAKGTALKTLNDIDVALYVEQESPPNDMNVFISWLISTLQALYPQMDASQIVRQNHSVRISYKGSGLDVDIVPILYDGDPNWDGQLYSAQTGQWVKTNISRHIEFIRARKAKNNPQFGHVVRLIKFWAKEAKKRDATFKFKSFLIELILAHLSDQKKICFNCYIEALASFFNYIITSKLKEKIVFCDYYSAASIVAAYDPMQIFDPANAKNNAAANYQQSDIDNIISAALEAGDAIDYALYATTKGDTVRCWQKVFGSSFGM